MEALNSLPIDIIDTLTKEVTSLSQKYATTLSDLDAEIRQTELAFSAMLDDLTGSEFDRKGLDELQKLLRG